jgi:hypothetical protein
VHQANLTQHALSTIVTGPKDTIQGIKLFPVARLSESPCIELKLESTATRDVVITPDNATEISTGTLSGTFESNCFYPSMSAASCTPKFQEHMA